MANKKFLYFLTDSTNKVYYLQNGVVAKSADLKPLANNPSGWREQSVKFARNGNYHGLIPSYTIPLKFVKDSAKILRHLLYNNGQEEIIYLIVLRFNYLIGEYEGYYKGEIDLAKATDNKDYFEVPVTEKGFYKLLKAYENTDFEIPFEGDGVIDVEMDGIDIKSSSKYIVPKIEIQQGQIGTKQYLYPISYATTDGTIFNVLTGSSDFKLLQNDTNVFPNDLTNNIEEFLLKNVGTETIPSIIIKGEVKFTVLVPTTYKLFLYATDGTNIRTIDLINTTTIASNVLYSYIIDKTFSLQANERLFLVQETNPAGVFLRINYEQTDFSFSVNSRYKTTYIKAIKPLNFGQLLLNKVTSSTDYKLQSSVLDSTQIVLTTGDQIRGFTATKAKSKFRDFFAAMHRNLVIGMEANEETKVINMPFKNSFYNSSVVYNLGEVRDCIFELNESLLHSNIRVGYPNQDYDNVNGKDEFNNTHNYTTPSTRSTSMLDLTHNWRSDCYGIELLRINLDGKTTTDNSSDNNIFLLDVVKKTGSIFSGTIFERAFNGSALYIPFNVIGFGFTSDSTNTKFTFIKTSKTLTVKGEICGYMNTGVDYLFSILVNSNVVYRTTNVSNTVTPFSYTGLFNTNDVIEFNVMPVGSAATFTNISSNFGFEGLDLYRLNRKTYTSITGVISPSTIFNVELSPKRILLAHQAYIKSTQWRLFNKKITFQTTEKNAELSTTLFGTTITENSDVNISDLTGEYFYPITAKFKAQVPIALLSLIKSNAYGVFEFTYLGNTYNGYLIECSQKPSGNEAQEWTLLLSTNNNLNNLIHA